MLQFTDIKDIGFGGEMFRINYHPYSLGYKGTWEILGEKTRWILYVEAKTKFCDFFQLLLERGIFVSKLISDNSLLIGGSHSVV